MSGEDRPSPHELVIVRRRGGAHHEGHHGGAWKIAFADFMTALMCFFLVMWLINATDKKTVTQIATYFNPLRLNDRMPSVKGLHDPGPSDARKESGASKQDSGQKSVKAAKASKTAKASSGVPEADSRPSETIEDALEAELMRDPLAALASIAANDPSLPQGKSARIGTNQLGLPLDFFDPLDRKLTDRGPNSGTGNANQSASGPPNDAALAQASESGGPNKQSVAGAASVSTLSATARNLDVKIQNALLHLDSKSKPRIEVRESRDSILISLTDEQDFGMFAIASARPTAALIVVMDRVASIIAQTSGDLTVRGHTDGRQYRTPHNDNWRLSAARAQIALFMLARGGVPDSRIRSLEGHADRLLKVPQDPLAAENRRIEILIAKEQP